ncbi:MAG: MFS transporter [Antricoccus sp.]
MLPQVGASKQLRPSAAAERRFPIWAIVAVLASCGTFVSLQQTLIIPMLVDLPKIFNTTPANTSWLVTATLLTSAIAMPVISRLADMYGKRQMLLLCVVLITVGSVIGALFTSLPLVILARSLQGFSTAMIPVGISIMRDELPKERVVSAVALMSATLGIGGAIGLPLGGVLYSKFGYHSIFWLSAIVGALMFVLILVVVSESLIKTPAKFDVVGSVIISVALLCVLLAVSQGSSWGWGSARVLGLFAGFVVLMIVWVPLELRTSAPLIDLRTSARKPVLLTNLATVLVGFSMFAQMLAVIQLLTLPTSTGYGFGLSPVQAGLTLLPGGALMVILAPVSAKITNRFGARTTLFVGAMVMAAGYVALVFSLGNLITIIIAGAAVNAGIALAYAAMPTLIMDAVPITETASANGLNALLRSVGTSSSSASVAAIMSAMSVGAGTLLVPTLGAFQTIFVISAVSAVGGALFAMLLPRRESSPDSFDPGAQYDTEHARHERAMHDGGVAAGLVAAKS